MRVPDEFPTRTRPDQPNAKPEFAFRYLSTAIGREGTSLVKIDRDSEKSDF
jgi:hypothetical protein